MERTLRPTVQVCATSQLRRSVCAFPTEPAAPQPRRAKFNPADRRWMAKYFSYSIETPMTISAYPHVQEHASEAANLLSFMATERQMHVLLILNEGEITVTSLADKVGITQSGVSQLLAKLRREKLVNTRRAAQMVYYSCTSSAVLKVLAVLEEIYRKPRIEVL